MTKDGDKMKLSVEVKKIGDFSGVTSKNDFKKHYWYRASGHDGSCVGY
jgi:hypothetical protein